MEISSFYRKYGFLILLSLNFVVFFVLALLTPVSYGGADDIVHYRFARYSFQHPELLLDHWAKPFFTLLASPFAQLGFWGVKLFNLILGSFTAILLYRMCDLMQIRRNILILIILFFTPVYTTMLMSGMTEILFATVLTLASFHFLKRSYTWSAIAISFLPLVRTEGIIIWPFFVAAYLLHRQWKAVPFVLTATAIYSLIGGFYFNDFLWLYTHIPYTGTYDIYGHGDLLHFVRSNKAVFGIPITLLFLAGIASMVFAVFKLKAKSKPAFWDEILVIIAPLLAYYCAHSYVWWKGINSLGLIRVMAAVAPLFALISLKGLNFLTDAVSLRILRHTIVIGALILIVITPFNVYEFPLPLTEKDKTVKKAAAWFQTSIYKDRKYYIWDCFFYFVLDTDPYDPTKMADGIPDRNNPENLVLPGEIVIWDAHFSAVDGRFPLASIIDNPYYKLIQVVRPHKPFVAGGGTYQLCFFERQDSAIKIDNRKILDSLVSIPSKSREVILRQEDFGNQGLKINAAQEYTMLYEMNVAKDSWNEDDELSVKLTSQGKPMILAVSVGNNKKLRLYESFSIHNTNTSATAEFVADLPEIKGNRQKLKVYVWNKQMNEASVHRIEIKLLKP